MSNYSLTQFFAEELYSMPSKRSPSNSAYISIVTSLCDLDTQNVNYRRLVSSNLPTSFIKVSPEETGS